MKQTIKEPNNQVPVPENSAAPLLIDVAEVARLMGVSSAWVRDHANRSVPRIPVVRFGRLMRFRPADIHQIIQHGFSEEHWRANRDEF